MEKSPDAFRTISEVAEWLDVQTHVLRFWESKFPQVKPVKRAGGRRYYRPADMRLIGGIKTLLHDDGMTIKGVQKVLREQGVAHVSSFSKPLDAPASEVEGTASEADQETENVVPFVSPAADAPPPAEPAQAALDLGADAPPQVAPAVEVPQDAPVATEKAAPPAPDQEPSILQESEPEPETPAEQEPQKEHAEAMAEAPPAASDASPEPEPAANPEPAAAPPAASPLPSFLTKPMGGGASPAVPRPVDAPDPPPEAEIEAGPGPLGRLAGLSTLDRDTARALMPLVSRLAALQERRSGTG